MHVMYPEQKQYHNSQCHQSDHSAESPAQPAKKRRVLSPQHTHTQQTTTFSDNTRCKDAWWSTGAGCAPAVPSRACDAERSPPAHPCARPCCASENTSVYCEGSLLLHLPTTGH